MGMDFHGATAPGAEVEYLTEGEGTTTKLPDTPVEFLQGVPARNLTAEEIEALEPALRAELEHSPLYSKAGTSQQDKPVQTGSASSTVVTPQKLSPPTTDTATTDKQGDA